MPAERGGALPRVLLVHNAYQQRGGEDSVVEAELEMLRSRGHAVELYRRHNDEIAGLPRIQLARDTLWSSRTTREIGEHLQAFKPDVVHIHNSFPLISPSVYPAVRAAGLPVVQTLHNFRLLCPQAMLLREGKVCEDCVGRSPWRGVLHRCYRDSAAQTALLAGMLQWHRWRGTWRDDVTLYIALNAFCRDKFVEGGLPAERLRIKPNFLPARALPPARPRQGLLFVGRLSPEKGVGVLAEALRLRQGRQTVTIVGDGPEAAQLQGLPGVHCLGLQDAAAVEAQMQQAAALLLPSIWYENFPRTLVEAGAAALPAIASRLGALPSLVADGQTGLLFEPGNAADLARCMDLAEQQPETLARMGAAARQRFEAEWEEEANYTLLMRIYAEARERVGRAA